MIRFFLSDLRRNLIKVLCLTIGMTVGFLLVAKIYFDQTYDTSFENSDRIFCLRESVINNGEFLEYPSTPGAVAPGLKRYAPQVECATRATGIAPGGMMRLSDGRTFSHEGFAVTDTCFFDIFTTPIIAGNPHDVLDRADMCMIPRSLADRIGGDVIGMTFTMPEFSEAYTAVIGGIYEDFPLNSTVQNRIYAGLPVFDRSGYHGYDNWIGNDRYRSYVRLAPGVSPEELRPAIDSMLVANIDAETLEVWQFNLHLKPLRGMYASGEQVRIMTWMLALLAVLILVCAALNYLLIVIVQMTRRSKEMAVRKCYGTSGKAIFGRVMGESLLFLGSSVILSLLIAYSITGLCGQLLGYSTEQLFSTGRVWAVEGAVCLVLLVLTGVVPAWLYCRTRVAEAFRRQSAGRRTWKMILLAVQFFATGMLMCLLVLVSQQYRMLNSRDLGFEYDNVGYADLSGISPEIRRTMVTELRRLGCVEGVGSSCQDFISICSGNNVWTADNWKTTVNVADFYGVNPSLFDVMGIPLVQGDIFRADADSLTNQVIVSSGFIPLMREAFGWEGENIIGRRFSMSDHQGTSSEDCQEICGVIGEMHRGSFESSTLDRRPTVMFPSSEIEDNLYVRFTSLTSENLAAAQKVLDGLSTRELYIIPYRNNVGMLNEPVKRFGKSVMTVGAAILIIALIGLIGYVADEVNRRGKEIAIRKVTGTSARQIIRLFCTDILKVALPSLVAGGATAIIVGRRWLSQFTEQVSLSPLSMALCMAVLAAVILAVVTINSLAIARSNPSDYLRTE